MIPDPDDFSDDESHHELDTLLVCYKQCYDERIAADKTAAALHERESEYKRRIIYAMQAKNLEIAAAHGVKVTLKQKERVNVTDWPAVYDYIIENRAFELLQRRISDAAVKEHGLDTVPGVELFEYYDIGIPTKA